MLVTLLGMVTELRLMQLENARFPKLITLFGMVTEVMELQSENTLSQCLSHYPEW